MLYFIVISLSHSFPDGEEDVASTGGEFTPLVPSESLQGRRRSLWEDLAPWAAHIVTAWSNSPTSLFTPCDSDSDSDSSWTRTPQFCTKCVAQSSEPPSWHQVSLGCKPLCWGSDPGLCSLCALLQGTFY